MQDQHTLRHLHHPAADRIGGAVRPLEGDGVRSVNPARPDDLVWAGTPVVAHADEAVRAARDALPAWSAMPLDARKAALAGFAARWRELEAPIGELIARETGKAIWDARAEAALIPAKVDAAIADTPHAGLARVADFSFELSPTRIARCRFRPHGVVAVIGPFNFPAHLPNGQAIPALLTGNTIVLKPSDKAPAIGQLYAALLDAALTDAGAPAGVVNLVHGGGEVARALVAHPGLDGILFTGSWPVGRAILEANLDRPGRLIALEMGGNNPAVVMPDADLRQAAIECARAAFITTGQRCTCTRRLIVHEDVADRLIRAIDAAAGALAVGDPMREDTFIGPLIGLSSRDAALVFQEGLRRAGADILRPMRDPGIDLGHSAGAFITPGVARVERFTDRPAGPGGPEDPGCDEEVFAPLLRVAVVRSLDEAIEQANATRFGLAASIFTRDAGTAERFLREARAGCVNVNCGTAGASGKLPFGGLGLSGNHRPAGAFAHDACAYPVATMVESDAAAPTGPGFAFDEAWLGS